MEEKTKPTKKKSKFWIHFIIGLLLFNGLDFLLAGFLPQIHNHFNMNNLNNVIQEGYGLVAHLVNYNPHKFKFPKIKRSFLPGQERNNVKKKYEALKNVSQETLSQMRQNVIKRAMKCLNIPYRKGGTKPSTGFDCSGFVYYIYNQVGIKFPRPMGKQVVMGRIITYTQLKPGDLIFFKGHGVFNGYSHVAIFKGVDSEGVAWVIHANKQGGSVRYEKLSVLPPIRLYKSYL